MTDIRLSELVHWKPKQVLANQVADEHRFTLFGGTRGPGKSYWLRWRQVRNLLRWGQQGYRGVRVMLGCETFPALRDRQIEKIEREFPVWLGEWNGSNHEFRLRPEFGAGVICCRNLDDATKYQSAEFAAIAIDELTKNVESTFHVLRGSLRWPGIERTEFIAGSNSNGLGTAWVRRLWIERQFPDFLTALAPEFAFVPALPGDNDSLPASYWEELKALPTTLRKSWLEGDWYAGVEGLVFEEFAAENLTDDEPDPEQPLELAFDDGYIDPRAMYLIQRTGTRILVCDELYQRQRLAESSVNDLVNLCKTRGWPLPEIAVGSPEAKELQARLRMADIPVRCMAHQVVDGLAVMRRLIRDGNGYRALQVNRRCRNLIGELTESYVYPEGKHTESEKPADGNDHGCDAVRYWAFMRARR